MKAQGWTRPTGAVEAVGVGEMKSLGRRARQLHRELKRVSAELGLALLALPNLRDKSVPPGKDDSSNVKVKR